MRKFVKMNSNSNQNSNLSFSQREGLEPLPTLLELGNIPLGMRGELFSRIDEYTDYLDESDTRNKQILNWLLYITKS